MVVQLEVGTMPRPLRPGDFGAELVPKMASVPTEERVRVLELSPLLYQWLDGECNMHTAEEFLSLIDGFPSALLAVLQWKPEELASARAQLAALLTGHVDERLLMVPVGPPPQHGMGAMRPEGRSHLYAVPDSEHG
ncbi:hypothetical protein HY632_04015 [Candidatus Uhrbacteria bacterium]|nr:hypothetical protein [Candidatus Uhrbacteria bacterium]